MKSRPGQKVADESFVKDQTQASLRCRDAEDHRNETGSSGEPSSELQQDDPKHHRDWAKKPTIQDEVN